jgi:arsenate reductase-like glutaredoxin family protein
MSQIKWSYHRPGCKTCGKTQDFLAKHKLAVATEVNAKKEPIDAEGALELARQMSHLVATKGKKVVEVNLKKNELSDDELRALVVGPSGNLRAPTLQVNKTLIVGFDEGAYLQHLAAKKT